MTENPSGSLQVNPEFVIEALVEENRSLNDNRLYLMSVIKQIKAEFEQAQRVWDAERESLKASKE